MHPEHTYQFIQKIARLPFVEEIWLFGSRARADHEERSDIDLAIICPQATQSDWSQVISIVEQADTLLKIDCVRFDTLAEEDRFKSNILKFKKPLYSKKGFYMDPSLWKDYFDNLGDAIARLKEVLIHPDLKKVDYLQDAAIQRFEFVIELYWKVLKKFLAYEKVDSTTPRDVVSKAFQFRLIDDEAVWLAMLDDRNRTSHVYKQEEAHRVFLNLKNYYPVMEATYEKLRVRLENYP